MSVISKSVLSYGFVVYIDEASLDLENLEEGDFYPFTKTDVVRLSLEKIGLPDIVVREFNSCYDQNLFVTLIPLKLSISSQDDEERVSEFEISAKDQSDALAIGAFLKKYDIDILKQGIIHFAYVDCKHCGSK